MTCLLIYAVKSLIRNSGPFEVGMTVNHFYDVCAILVYKCSIRVYYVEGFVQLIEHGIQPCAVIFGHQGDKTRRQET